MNQQIAFLLLFSIVCSYEVPNMFYVFQLQWPGSICSVNQCKSQFVGNYKGRTWAIHGLWPSATGNQGNCEDLETCERSRYSARDIPQSTMKELDQAWVGFFNPTDNFRSHEWSKHGTCWDEKDDLVPQKPGMTTQDEYFQTALQLWKTYNLYDILMDNDIVPEDGTFYNTEDIKYYIKQEIKTDVQLLCTKDDRGKLVLLSVSFCLSDKYQPIKCQCPVYGGIPCGKNRNDKVQYKPYRL